LPDWTWTEQRNRNEMEVDGDRLLTDVRVLAQSARPPESRQLEEARRYVTEQLQEAGWLVERCPFRGDAAGLSGVNLVARHPQNPPRQRPWFCFGAHLDTVPNSPGADDNASAVATLLEVARRTPVDELQQGKLALELVVFDLEECGMLGAETHARAYRRHHRPLAGMVSLEMLGYCDHTPGSQSLPRKLVGRYPDTANFIALIGNTRSLPLMDVFSAGMREVPGLPVETLAVEGNGEYLQATRLSDHSPFWDAGYQALMVTDTSFLRNPHYHLPSDTVETLDFKFLELVAEGCLRAVRRVLREGLAVRAAR